MEKFFDGEKLPLGYNDEPPKWDIKNSRAVLVVGNADAAALQAMKIALKDNDIVIVDLSKKTMSENLNNRIRKFEEEAQLVFENFKKPTPILPVVQQQKLNRYQRRLQQKKKK